MISGQLFKLEFPLAHFATEGITADVLFPIIWEGIRLAESTGLKVIAVTADGVPIENYSQCMEIVTSIKPKNFNASDDRYVHFISNPPHFIKTARNCLSHSHVRSHSRSMWVSSGMYMCIYTNKPQKNFVYMHIIYRTMENG